MLLVDGVRLREPQYPRNMDRGYLQRHRYATDSPGIAEGLGTRSMPALPGQGDSGDRQGRVVTPGGRAANVRAGLMAHTSVIRGLNCWQ